MQSNGLFRDGAIVFGGLVNWAVGDEPSPEGYQRLRNPYYSLSLHGGEIVHFGKSPRAFARGDRMALGTRDRYEISFFDAAGRLSRIIRVQLPPVIVTEEHLDGLLEEWLARLPSPTMAPAFRSGFRSTPHAETMPAFEDLLLDSEGFLWVEDIHIPGDSPRTWAVFDEQGVPRTRLSFPFSNRVLDIGDDYILAVFEDESGVEHFRSYPLTRGL
jgi:hypothetical protein